MFQNLEIKTKISISFILLVLITILFGLYILLRINSISNFSKKITEATNISQLALDFNVESFHTQFKIWEYAYEPTNNRLVAFKESEESLLISFSNLLNSVKKADESRKEKENTSVLIENGREQIEDIGSDLAKARLDWKDILKVALEEQEARERGVYERSIEYIELREKTRKLMIANENLFDELEFNSDVDKFVNDQGKLVEELLITQENLIENFVTTFFVIIIFIALFSIISGVILSSSILDPIRNLHKGIEIIEKGNLDYKVGTLAEDEIGRLSRSFDKMTQAIKESRADVDRKVEEQVKIIREQKERVERTKERIEKMNELMTGREIKMAELKEELKKWKKKLKNIKKENV